MELINDNKILSHIVTKNDKLFTYLKNELVLSLRQTNSFIKSRNIYLNNKEVTKNINVKIGDVIKLVFEDETNEYEPKNISLDILYESYDLLVINKKPNILVHPTKTHSTNTLANAIAYYYNQINLKRKIRFVSRLDMDTSGILVIAKNAYAHQFLAKQFDNDSIEKKYFAIIEGHIKQKNGIIESKILHNEENTKYEINEQEGKNSITIYNVIKETDKFSLVECEIKSGRTHQIRVHLSSIGGYIIGDSFYGKESAYINRQALHSHKLSFIEPRTFKKITIQCDLPDDMKRLLNF